MDCIAKGMEEYMGFTIRMKRDGVKRKDGEGDCGALL